MTKKNCTFVLKYYEKMIREITAIIHHRGVVEKIDGPKCYVRILQHSACSGCAAHKLCNSSESKEKIVEALNVDNEIRVGDTVDVEGTVSQGLRAVYLCYLIPLVLMILFLFLGYHLGGELTGIVFSLFILTVYYFVLYLCRNKIGKHFCFTVHKK
jgi:sigma-E factor negative regulatory protein RseC